MFKSKNCILFILVLALAIYFRGTITIAEPKEKVELVKINSGYPLQMVEATIEDKSLASIKPIERVIVGVSAENINVQTYEEKLAEEEARIKAEQWANEVAYLEAQGINVPYWESGCRSSNYTFMSYTAVTSRTSAQWKLLRGDSCYTDSVTGIRMVDDRYCIAVGTYYAPCIGTKLDVVFADNTILKCIVGDFKSNKDTDSSNRYQACDGSVIEFIVDRSIFKGVSQYPIHDLEIRKIVQVS